MQMKTVPKKSPGTAGALLAACALVGGAVSAFGSLSAPAFAKTTPHDESEGSASTVAGCSVKTLDLPEGATTSWVSSGSPDGTKLVGYATIDGEEQAMMWSNGKPREILVDLRNVTPAAVNNDGVVAGFGFEKDEPVRTSFLYRDGEPIELAAPENADATVTDINADGDAVGYGVGDNSALRWDFESPDEVEKLSTPAENEVANGIEDGGVAAGYSGIPDEGTDAVVWSQGGDYEELPALDGATHSLVESIRGDFATGVSTDDLDDSTQALWNLKTGKVAALPESLYKAHDVNESGTVAASAEDGHAAIVDDGRTTRLPHAGGDSSQAYTIADDGTAAGSSQDSDGSAQAVMWKGC